MCGLAGYWDIHHHGASDSMESVGYAMAKTLYHRGPDASGVWCDKRVGLVLGHQRLSIIDLTATGRQPMISRSGQCVIAYNGEIYNAHELRRELEKQGIGFVGTSDTEVVLEACEF